MPHSMHAKHRKYLVQYGSIVCGNPYCFFLWTINYKKKKCSIFNDLWDRAHPKSSTFAKYLTIFYLQEY